jgi:hypothetical protein
MPLTSWILLILSVSKLSLALAPLALSWSSKTYGPDGPWHAINVQVGTPSQSIDLFPGLIFDSVLLGSPLCSGTCDAQKAGLYNVDASTTAVRFTASPLNVNTSAGLLTNVSDTPTLDVLTVQTPDQGVPPPVLPSFDYTVWTSGMTSLPGGLKYPLQIGSLAFGAQSINRTFGRGPNLPDLGGTLLVNQLFLQNIVPSRSFTLHIGSPSQAIPPSLYVGGYDQNRALGQVTTQPYDFFDFPIDMLDIGIDVAVGKSPFQFPFKTGLMAQGNSSLSASSLRVLVDPSQQYLSLPQSTCDAITSELPVFFKPEYGLYLWNTSSPQYTSIVSSPSFLQFTFRLNNSVSSTNNVTINVPFSLLNLTLTEPVVSTPTPYFPCTPVSAGSNYFLGKAFLQAAFMGATFQDGANGAWFLAQAPGPDVPSAATVGTISQSDHTVIPSKSNWTDTWKGSWKPIGGDNTSDTGSLGSNSTSNQAASTSKDSTGISTGAIVGIVVGVVGAVALLSAAFFMYRRKSKLSKSSQPATADEARPELDSSAYTKQPMYNDSEPQEMMGQPIPPAYKPQELQG